MKLKNAKEEDDYSLLKEATLDLKAMINKKAQQQNNNDDLENLQKEADYYKIKGD